jgi:hypothetical protein
MKSFNARRSLKGAMKAVRWMMTATFFNPDNVTFAQQLNEWDKSFKDEIDQVDPESPVKEVKKKLSFRDSYELKDKIRKGSFATVWECEHKATGDAYAVKVIKREALKPSEDEAVLNEVAIVQSLEYKYIVQIVDFYEEPDYFFIIMELMGGGDVFDRIVEKTRYTEKDARDLVRILLKVCKFMHERGVAHRDLKPQNLLLKVCFCCCVHVAGKLDFWFCAPLTIHCSFRAKTTTRTSRSAISALLVVYIHLSR